VRDLITRYHARSAEEGTKVVPCCGFDSVPSDLGAWLIARHLRGLGSACADVRAYFQMAGGLNGGTLASALNMIESGQGRAMREPFLLDPAIAHSALQVARSQDVTGIRFDADLGAWTGPFVMAPTNTRVVRRSAALFAEWGEPYGGDFVYQEYLKFDPPLARAKAGAVTIGFGLFFGALVWEPARHLVKPLLPKPGAGPSQRTMNNGWFRCELIGRAEDGRQARGLISHRGDPGNRATVRFLCESALALASDSGGRGGVLTPATAFGQVLVDRLRRAGVTIEIG
jgi:short subunit dehydrogenase-like uncharacterized protein